MRVGYLDAKNSSHSCPSGFTLYNSPRRCGLYILDVKLVTVYIQVRCCRMFSNFVSYLQYSVPESVWKDYCLPKGTTDAFNNHYVQNSSISSTYVAGVSWILEAPHLDICSCQRSNET